jgi:putative transposase
VRVLYAESGVAGTTCCPGREAARGLSETVPFGNDAAMSKRRIYDRERHAHFLTFSCYKRRRLLDTDRPKKIVLGVLNSQLSRQQGLCAGFVVMPNHVHAIMWFPADNQISEFLKQWKRRSSIQIKRLLRTGMVSYRRTINPDDPVWQAGFYDFNIYSSKKLREKLEYMHQNPVAKGLAVQASDWPWSSARHYESRRSVGVPISWID